MIRLFVVVYIVGFILAFGHSAAQTTQEGCRPQNPNCFIEESATANGLMAGVFWPLYLSKKINLMVREKDGTR